MVWLSTFESKILLKMQYSSATFLPSAFTWRSFLSRNIILYTCSERVISSIEFAVVKQAVHLPIMEICYSCVVFSPTFTKCIISHVILPLLCLFI